MRRIHLIPVVVLILGALIFAYSQMRQRSEPQTPQVASRTTNEQRLQRTITTQQRLNRYFHGSVIPKLKNCWSRVPGRGTIEIVHSYTRDANSKWVVDKLTVGKSTLPRGQDAVALQCMQDAARGTSFSVASDDGDIRQYSVKWTWPVPFPANMVEQTRAMFAATGGGGGPGCDGKGTPPGCWDCVYQKDGIPKCKQQCKGYEECAYGPQDSCQARRGCVTGGPDGVAGRGTIIY